MIGTSRAAFARVESRSFGSEARQWRGLAFNWRAYRDTWRLTS
jgi:hypothetical protein